MSEGALETAIMLLTLFAVFVLLIAFNIVMGLLMENIISNWLGKDMNSELYWTGVGLVTLLGFVIGAKSRGD